MYIFGYNKTCFFMLLCWCYCCAALSSRGVWKVTYFAPTAMVRPGGVPYIETLPYMYVYNRDQNIRDKGQRAQIQKTMKNSRCKKDNRVLSCPVDLFLSLLYVTRCFPSYTTDQLITACSSSSNIKGQLNLPDFTIFCALSRNSCNLWLVTIFWAVLRDQCKGFCAI